MSVYKMVEVVGTSGTSVSDAIQGAVARASATLEDCEWFEVKEIRGRIKDGEVAEYQVKMDIGFLLHAPANDATPAREQAGAPKRTRQSRSVEAQIAAKGGDRRRTDIARGFKRQTGSRRS